MSQFDRHTWRFRVGTGGGTKPSTPQFTILTDMEAREALLGSIASSWLDRSEREDLAKEVGAALARAWAEGEARMRSSSSFQYGTAQGFAIFRATIQAVKDGEGTP